MTTVWAGRCVGPVGGTASHGEGGAVIDRTSLGVLARARSGVGRTRGRGAGVAGVRVPEVVVGVMLVVGCALGGVLWFRSATDPRTVVVAAGELPRGHVIAAEDLGAATVSAAEGISLIAGADADELLGRVLQIDLEPGEPITPAVVGDSDPLGPGEALLATSVGPGEYPPSLSPGDAVRVVVVPEVGADEVSDSTVTDRNVMVWAVEAPTEVEPRAVVTLRLPFDLAAEIAVAASVRLVQVGG